MTTQWSSTAICCSATYRREEDPPLLAGLVREVMNREGIKEILPHREPFLLIDEVTEYEPGKGAKAIWHITEDLPFFRGHFPGRPTLPGVLMAEALAQTGAIAILTDDRFRGRLAVFGGIDKMKFRGMVEPGADLELETELTKLSRVGGRGHGTARVNGKVVAEGELMFAFAPEKTEKSGQ